MVGVVTGGDGGCGGVFKIIWQARPFFLNYNIYIMSNIYQSQYR